MRRVRRRWGCPFSSHLQVKRGLGDTPRPPCMGLPPFTLVRRHSTALYGYGSRSTIIAATTEEGVGGDAAEGWKESASANHATGLARTSPPSSPYFGESSSAISAERSLTLRSRRRSA